MIISSRSNASQWGRSQPSTFGQRRKSPGDERIERRDLEHFLGPVRIDANRHFQIGDDRLDGPGFLLRRVAEVDDQIGPQNRDHDARHAAAGADIEHSLALFQQFAELVAIDDIAADELFDRRVPRQVHPLVPRPQQAAIEIELFDLVVVSRDLVRGKLLFQLSDLRRDVIGGHIHGS